MLRVKISHNIINNNVCQIDIKNETSCLAYMLVIIYCYIVSHFQAWALLQDNF